MAELTQWEYRVVIIGGWTGFKTEAAEAALNALGLEGWELVSGQSDSSSRFVAVAKRLLTETGRRRRNYPEGGNG